MNITGFFQLAINLFLLSASVLLLFISLILRIIRLSDVRRLVFLSLFLFSSSLWFLLRNPTLSADTVYRPALEIMDVLCQYAITFFSLTYVREFVNGRRKKIMGGCQVWTILFAVVTSLLHFHSELKYADTLTVGAICNVIFIVLMGSCIVREAFWEKNRDTRRLLVSAVPALIGGLLEISNFLIGNGTPTTILFYIGFLIFMLLQMFWFIRNLQEQAQRSAKMEKELMESRISIMFSQIQPHFLYNSLLGIKQLCDTEPKKASDALEHFAYYLRGNLYSISDSSRIPFTKELEHLKDYLYLEQMRFGERLNIHWDIGCTDFLLPSLTLQPIVENAVRHGITKKEDGGTITIQSEQTADAVLLTVTDDGVGFDAGAVPDDSRPHVGIENVKKRLELQCEGRMEIFSTPGEGTKVKIFLPWEEVKHENTCSR